MKILLVGSRQEAAAVFQSLFSCNDHEFTHCTDGAHAIAELRRHTGKYDWAIMDNRAVLGSEKDLARIIRMMGPQFYREQPVPGRAIVSPDWPSTTPACGVEWSKNGILELHCGLHSMLRDAAKPCDKSLGCAGEVLFEYHAPCNQRRGPDD